MNLDRCRFLDLPKITDERGSLTFVESDRHIPFSIRRIFYLYEVPPGGGRGGHAHKGLEQVLVALSGSFDVVLDDGGTRSRITLNEPCRGLYVPRMVWGELDRFSSGAVCLVIASEHYSEDDYFRDYDDFLRARGLR